MGTTVLDSILTCPECGFTKQETMPTDACQFFYQCDNCQATLRPKAGDCCVFCSYGSVKCPPIQEQRNCCSSCQPQAMKVGAALMSEHIGVANDKFNPSHLLDTIIERMKLKNDAALSRLLEVAPPLISKIRNGRMPVGASLLIRMHEETNISIRELRDLMGDKRHKYRLSNVQGKPAATAERTG